MILLSDGNKYYDYSGVVTGDVSVPATIQLNFIPNTGLRDSMVIIQPFFGQPASTGGSAGLGFVVKIDDVEVLRDQLYEEKYNAKSNYNFNLFVPRQSKLEIISLNTSANNTQPRGCNLLGYYL